jgi:glycine/D-amino acid oxidase-like deaminating enzyme
MSRLGRPYWADRTADNRRRSYPAFRGKETTDAVVIGGGLTGCAVAYSLAGAGVGVTLLEANRLADGGTARGLGAILPQPDALFRTSERDAGRRAARAAWSGAERGASEFARVLEALPTQSDVSEGSLCIDAIGASALALLRKEQAARRAGGVVAPWLPPAAARTELGSESSGALRLGGAFLVDPVRAALGLAGAAESSGARIFEHSEVRRTRFTRKDAEVILTSGSIRTRLVVVATAEPGTLFGQLRRHVRRQIGYAVVTEPLSAAMRRETGHRVSVVTDVGPTPHWLRWLTEDRALFAGALGKPAPARQQEKVLIQRTAQLMYELSVRHPVISGLPAHWGWDVPVVTTPDGLPWIGPHRNYPYHFFAIALGWHGDALAWRAARAALRHLKGEWDREDDVLGFARYL